MENITYNGTVYSTDHGTPFDCGMADSYYRRLRKPRYFLITETEILRWTETEMNQSMIDAYNAGYDYNENELQDFKDTGYNED